MGSTPFRHGGASLGIAWLLSSRILRSPGRGGCAISSGSATRSASMTRTILVNRVVVAVADRSERGHQPRRAYLAGERPRGELDSVVGMHDPTRGGLAVSDRHVESVDDKVGVLSVVDRPVHDLPGERVHHGAAVDFSFPRLNPSDRCNGLIYDVFSKAAMRSAGVSQSREFAVDEIIGGRNTMQSLHFRRPGKPGDPGLAHQHSYEPLANPDPHPESKFGMHPPGTVGLAGRRVNFPNQTGQSLTAHLRRRDGSVLVSVVARAADPQKSAADFGPIASLNEDIAYRVNAFGPGRSSSRSFAAIFRISTSDSSCRIRFFAFASSMLSGVVLRRSPRSI
ncbi:Long-chain-fatty-acid--CoA ligase [Leifsonia rubra CMS 76R]|nr:Long-chain-fatty-acid--CoA ligase [Leifsonia rubra CMS 76R]